MDVQVVMQYTEQFSDMEILDDNFVDEFEESIRENEESDTDMDQDDDCNEQLIAAGVLQEFVDKKNEKEEDGKEKGGKGKGGKGKDKGKDKKGKGGKGKNKKGKGISGKKSKKN